MPQWKWQETAMQCGWYAPLEWPSLMTRSFSPPRVDRTKFTLVFQTNGMTLMMEAEIPSRASAEGKSTRACWTTNETQPVSFMEQDHISCYTHFNLSPNDMNERDSRSIHVWVFTCIHYSSMVISTLTSCPHLLIRLNWFQLGKRAENLSTNNAKHCD